MKEENIYSECASYAGGRQEGFSPLIPLLAILLAVIALLGFTLYDPEKSGGDLYQAVVSLQDILEENEVICVFLGLTEKEEDAIKCAAEEYIRTHEAEK